MPGTGIGWLLTRGQRAKSSALLLVTTLCIAVRHPFCSVFLLASAHGDPYRQHHSDTERGPYRDYGGD